MRKWTVCVSSMALLAAGCGGRPEGYFPLEKGRQWKYNFSVESKGSPAANTEFKVFTMEKRTLQGRDVVPIRTEINGVTSLDFYVTDDSGVYKTAEQKPTDAEPIPVPISYILKFPIAKGVSWKMLRSLQPEQPPMMMDCEVAEQNEAVATEAGKFSNGLETDCNTKMHVQGASDFLVEIRFWYVNGLGLVRTEGQGKDNRGAPIFHFKLDLVSYKK
jgi:hypothetical protein